MSARQYVAIEPLHEMPAGPWVPYNDRADALAGVLRDVELGGYDELAMGWLVRHLDNPTMRTLVSREEAYGGR